jgi:uncharacterized protein YbaP (TraB family)
MKRLLFLFLLIPLLSLSQTANKYPTLLWEISGKNLKKPSYLYGTMHVSNRVAYNLSEQFFDALKSVEVVGLETNPGEWLESMEKTGELDEISKMNYAPLYRGEFYKSAFALNFPEKKLLQSILSYDPDIIDGLLYRENRVNVNFEESTYIDLFIYQTASKLNKELISLEDFAQSAIKARLSALPDEETDETTAARTVNDYYQKIEDAYRDGNLDMLDSLNKIISTKNTQRFLIEDRNEFFVNTIDSVLKDKSLFSGVGAAHLPGEKGVIELLRAKGYRVEPIYPKVTKKSNAFKDEIDSKVKAVALSKQYIPDSIFSCSVPGKLYPIIHVGNLNYYINADMVNGSFYTIVRLKHLGPLFNLSPDELMKRVDSLLFENIPGKILLKKEILSNTGIKGIEIVNRTRNGNEQHYQIYFTPLELIIFKLGGKHSYATGSESKIFFNSIKFETTSDQSVLFSPQTKGFKVKIPASHAYTKQSNTSVIGLLEDLYAYDNSKKEFCGIQHAVYNDFFYLEEDSFELNQFSKHILKNLKFEKDVINKLGHENGFPCIYIQAKNSLSKLLEAKVFIKGVHYYLVFKVGDKQGNGKSEFFDSFTLTDFEYINPIKEITDKDFYFKVKDEITENALSRFNDSYAKAYEGSRTVKKKEKKDFDFRSDSKYYYSPSSNEYVSIFLEKYNDYDYRDPQKLEKKIEKNLLQSGSMFLTNQKSNSKEGLYTYACSLKDTATQRAIALKLFIRNGLMLEILAPYDTTIGLQGWTKGFFESFTPMDTVIGKNVLENKFEQLLNDLSSSDTLVRRTANTSLFSIGFQPKFAEAYVKFLSSEKLAKINEDGRAQMFVNGGTLETEKIIVPYRNLYTQYTDSFYLQLCLLKGLAYLKTQNSYNEFYNLILKETPLVGAENTISDVFMVLHDSLELCKKFFPGMLALTKYDEYREAVYTLMAELVHKNILSSANYAAQKETILSDAVLALKRYTPQNSRNRSGANDGSFDYLDKLSQENAEDIKSNLEGLSNNNLFKGTKYLTGLDAAKRHALINYVWILSPFYKTDEKCKQFFTKLSKLKAQNIAMPLAIHLLKQNTVIIDTLISYYAKNKFTRAYFYSELEKEKLLEKFDETALSQKSLIESLIQSQIQLNGYYNYEKEKLKKDSMVFLKELVATNKYQKGKLFIYKNARSKGEDETWSIAFVNEVSDKISCKIELIHTNYFLDKTLTEEENLMEVQYYFSLSFRNRAQVISNAYSN